MCLGEIEDRLADDDRGTPQAEPLFDAETIPGLEGKDHFDRVGGLRRSRFDLRQPTAKISAHEADRSLVFRLEKGRSPALERRTPNIGREFAVDGHATLDELIHPCFVGARLNVPDEGGIELGGELFIHGGEERFHVGEVSENRADADICALRDLLRGRRERAFSDQIEQRLNDGRSASL